ncbi:MAG: rhomboid family intramembrane serine protease [Syntrophobacteraceae bacterium]|nr:rhomboid family intramembrane serine protease [Syntrophobacteraceae bacterium]
MGDPERSSILCPNCRRLISRHEPICPHCGLRHPGTWSHLDGWIQKIRHPEDILKAIIWVNVGMFVLSLLLNPSLRALSLDPFSLLSPDNRSLLLLGATGSIPIDRLHRWWTLLSANYLHAGILHIAFNMIALRQIGLLILYEFGISRTVILYTLSGMSGYLLSYLAGVPFTLGASTAVCGLIGAALYFGRSRGGSFGRMVYRQVGGWALGIFLFGLLVPGINNWGHGGGLLSGAGLAFLLGYQERKPENLFHKFLAVACMVSTLAVLGWAVMSALLIRS